MTTTCLPVSSSFNQQKWLPCTDESGRQTDSALFGQLVHFQCDTDAKCPGNAGKGRCVQIDRQNVAPGLEISKCGCIARNLIVLSQSQSITFPAVYLFLQCRLLWTL